MKIASVTLSVFELTANTRRFDLAEETVSHGRAWRLRQEPRGLERVQVMEVMTDEGVEGRCTLGDARSMPMGVDQLEQLRMLVVGQDALDQDRLFDKLTAATRQMFTPPGWFGAFDNCLWDVAGKAQGRPVAYLLGGARERAPVYYNFFGPSLEAMLDDAQGAWDAGFTRLKDHYSDLDGGPWTEAFEAVRARFPEAVLMHDAALAAYSPRTALQTGRLLEALDFLWFEEPLPDRSFAELRRLSEALVIPVLSGETLMHEPLVLAQMLEGGSCDMIRGNGRHGTTPAASLAALAGGRGTSIEFNGPGGLFGLVHAHYCCGLAATGAYEFFPGGTRDLLGKEIGLTNPPMPIGGYIAAPSGPGWGAEWDQVWYEKARVAVL
jgi:L-alanine-DL-glutamate epimerase-like enolase superfamily enzyme